VRVASSCRGTSCYSAKTAKKKKKRKKRQSTLVSSGGRLAKDHKLSDFICITYLPALHCIEKHTAAIKHPLETHWSRELEIRRGGSRPLWHYRCRTKAKWLQLYRATISLLLLPIRCFASAAAAFALLLLLWHSTAQHRIRAIADDSISCWRAVKPCGCVPNRVGDLDP